MTKGLPAYLVRRLLFALLLVFLVSSGAFLLSRVAPGDVTTELFERGMGAEAISRERARLGLDRPLVVQYAEWLGRLGRFDLGTSYLYQRPVGPLVGERAANTATLAVAALILATLIGLPLGVFTGSRPRGVLPAVVRGSSIVSLSLPPLLTSLVLVLLAARTGWFPIGGMLSRGVAHLDPLARVADLTWHLTLPALALALPLAATFERLQARALADALSEPFVLAAHARGIPRDRLLWRHALRIAVKPVAALYGIVIGNLLSGSFAVEIVTAWPGLGQLMYDALRARDVHLVAGCAAVGSVFLAVGTLISDLALALVDPRLREAP